MNAPDARLPREPLDTPGLAQIPANATGISSSLRQQTHELKRRAYVDGYAAGHARAQAETVRQALEAQLKARQFADAFGEQIVDLALACVERMASTLGSATVVTALLTDALGAIRAQRILQVTVSQSAVEATRAVVARWQEEHPQALVQVSVDAQLEPFGCAIESELGRIDLGLRKQLEATRKALSGQGQKTSSITLKA